MKQAKKRPSPILSRLVLSTRRANRAITSALGYVSASNRRLTKLEQLLAEMPKGPPVDLPLENLAPVGQEIGDDREPSATDQMRHFMVNAPPTKVSTEAIRALKDEGRN